MKQIDMTNVREAGESNRLPVGKYVCVITTVEDCADKEYLKVSYDIAEGKYAGHFHSIRSEHPDWEWVGAYVKSYKPKALPMFKRFCSAISKSNGGFVFDGGQVNADETTLVGKKLGIIFQEEEYISNSGDIRTRLIVYSECPLDKLAEKRVPDPKRLPAEEKPKEDFVSVSEGTNEDIPF